MAICIREDLAIFPPQTESYRLHRSRTFSEFVTTMTQQNRKTTMLNWLNKDANRTNVRVALIYHDTNQKHWHHFTVQRYLRVFCAPTQCCVHFPIAFDWLRL